MAQDNTKLVTVTPDEFVHTPGGIAAGGNGYYTVFGQDQDGQDISIRMSEDQGQRFLSKHGLEDRMPRVGHEPDPIAQPDGQTIVKMKPVLLNADTAKGPSDVLKDVGPLKGYVEARGGQPGNNGLQTTRLIGDLSTEATFDANAALSTKDGHLHVRDMQAGLAASQSAARRAEADAMQPHYDAMLAQLREGGLSGIRKASSTGTAATGGSTDLAGEAVSNLRRNRIKGPDDLGPTRPTRRPGLGRGP